MPVTDAIRTSLELSIDQLQNLLTVWTFMVALGLILEYGAIIARTGHSKRNGPAFAWIQVFTILGGLFITIGVAGELVAESGIAVVMNRPPSIVNTCIHAK